MNRLSEKIAFISGAGEGIGRAAAILFARQGCSVVIAERDMDAANEVATEIQCDGGIALALPVDVCDAESVRLGIAETVARFGGLDILYNNAVGASLADAPVTDAPPEEFWRRINVDLLSTWLCCTYGIPELIARGGGSVINMSSVSALMRAAGKNAYTEAKGAVASLTRSMAIKYARHSVRVNAIAPGITRTPRVDDFFLRDRVPANLFAGYLLDILELNDVEHMALYLASDESCVVTGQVIVVDSGGGSIS